MRKLKENYIENVKKSLLIVSVINAKNYQVHIVHRICKGIEELFHNNLLTD